MSAPLWACETSAFVATCAFTAFCDGTRVSESAARVLSVSIADVGTAPTSAASRTTTPVSPLTESTAPPPWGEIKPPAELPVVPGKPVVHGAEAPGEALRRSARELIDGLPAIDLPSAIAFLEFLRQRAGDAARARGAAGEASERDRDRELDDDARDARDDDPIRRAAS